MKKFQFDYNRMIVGHHGCDLEIVKKVILDGEPMKPSINPYDWLGNGIYFWEYGPQRALERFDAMTDDEKFQTFVNVGIYTQDGELTERYGGTAPNEED